MNYTLCLDRKNGVSLLFDTLDEQLLVQSKEIQALFPKGYFITQVNQQENDRWKWRDRTKELCHTMVSTSLAATLPDEADPGEVVSFYIGGKVHNVSLRERYNACLSLFKAVGCAECPERGAACLSTGRAVPIPPRTFDAATNGSLDEYIQKNKPKLEGFTFVHPSSTRTGSFTAALRGYWDHDFRRVKVNTEELSLKAIKAAATKKFKKTECAKCLIKPSCSRSSWCKGAYPPEKEIIDRCVGELAIALEKSPVPAWQLYECAWNMGKEAKHSRWNIVLTGVTLDNKVLLPTIHRAKCSIDPYRGLKTYAEIAEVFELCKTEDEFKKQWNDGPDDVLRATFWLALNAHRAYQRYGWGCSRSVTGVGIKNHVVEVMWTNGKYLGYTSELHRPADVAAKMTQGSLPLIDQVEIR